MLPTTIDAIKAILKADPTVNPADRAVIVACIRNGCKVPATAPAVPAEVRILRRHEAAKRLGCGLRCIDNWARTGILHKVTLPGHIRACGVRLSDVEALIQETGNRSVKGCIPPSHISEQKGQSGDPSKA
ncbi:MAG: helix-turn-helix domain-containing protein [bacterium]